MSPMICCSRARKRLTGSRSFPVLHAPRARELLHASVHDSVSGLGRDSSRIVVRYRPDSRGLDAMVCTRLSSTAFPFRRGDGHTPVLAKHSKSFSLIDCVSRSIPEKALTRLPDARSLVRLSR